MTLRGKDWQKFSNQVLSHINEYTVPQYGDKGSDLAEEYTPETCISQVKKYLTRFGKNQRQGQEKLDLLKLAHYIQMAYTQIVEGETNE